MAVNNTNELREALKLPTPDTPAEYWEAVVECLRVWGASNRAFGGYAWERELYAHTRARIRKRFQAEGSKDLDIRARGITTHILSLLHDVHDAQGREWILKQLTPETSSVRAWIQEHVPLQTSGVSTPATPALSNTSTGWCSWACIVLAIGGFLVCTRYLPDFNPLCIDCRTPLASTCAPPTKESAALWHIVTKDFSIAQDLIPSLSSRVTSNSALDRSDESAFHRTALNVRQASIGVVDGIHLYTSCLHDFTIREETFDDRDNDDATHLVPTALLDQIETFSHKASMTTDSGLKLWLLLDRLVMAIKASRALIHATRIQNSLGGNTNGSAGQTTLLNALLNTLSHLERSAERCRYFLSRTQEPAKKASSLTRQGFKKTIETRLGSTGAFARKADVILREFHALDAIREKARAVVRDWQFAGTTKDDFLFRGEDEERMWNAMQPAAGEWVLKD